MKKFTADFETNVNEFDCRVWAYGLCEIGNPSNFIYGNNIEDFIKFCQNKKENYVLYFHNLKFDGEYILSYLLNNNYEYIKNKKDAKDKTFTCLINEMGQFYSIEIFFDTHNKRHVNKVTIYDSIKIINSSVEKIAKDFDLEIRKGSIDYKLNREVGHILTEEEVDYLKNDVEIMARALNELFKLGLTKMTIGSNALNYYRKTVKFFNKYFPLLKFEIDQDIRQSYKGGFTYLNPIKKDKIIENGIVLDVNSLYPSVMKNAPMPFGEPIYFTGEYKKDILHPLYVQMITCVFKLKKGKIPTIQIKGTLSFIPNEYLESSNDELVTLCLTNIDLKLFFENYDTWFLSFNGGWKFKQIRGLFDKYIDTWTNNKIQAKKDNNKSMYAISKLMLNSLYGKFSKSPKMRSKYPVLEEGIVKYKMTELEIVDSLYIPIGSFITAYAREKTIRTSQKIRDYTINKYGEDYYIYSDTDSIHMKELPEEELKSFLDIDDYKLGAWKLESKFKKGKFIRQKCYIEQDYDDIVHSTIAGLPKRLSKYVTFENFTKGFSILKTDENYSEKKLAYKHVKGGVLLVDTDFTIK